MKRCISVCGRTIRQEAKVVAKPTATRRGARERDTGRVRDRGEQGEGESKTRGEGKKQRHHRHEKKTTAYVCMKSKLPDKVVPITPRKHLWVLI